MTKDVVRQSGYLTLGSRLRRIGERLQGDVQKIGIVKGFELHGSLWTTLIALDREGELTVGELAHSLGIAQPGVTRNLKLLEARGLIEPRRSTTDQRVKRIELSEEGRTLVGEARRKVWPVVEEAVAEMCAGLKGPLLAQLAAIEDALDQSSLDRRVEDLIARKRRK
jgi:DNA-binding MarR family transcriptional regulator